MSRFGWWCLWIGLGLVVVTVIVRVLDLIPATVIAGLLALVVVGMAGYDWLYYATQKAPQREREAAKREREAARREAARAARRERKQGR
jgi:hypothetical protein